MGITTGADIRPYDTAEFLTTPGRIAAYLDLAAQSGDARHIAGAIGTVIRSGNVSELARKTGFTREGLSKAFSDRGNPSLDMILKVMAALGHRVAFPAADNGEKGPRKAKRRSAIAEPV